MKHIATVVLIIAGMLFSARTLVSSSPFSYDEADYMFAAEHGFVANFLDRPAQSFRQFLDAGLGRGRSPEQKLALSEEIRLSGDMNFYRHWHGPLYYYWLAMIGPGAGREHLVRGISLLFPAIAVVILYFGTLWLLGSEAWLAALLAAATYAWGVPTVAATELAPHQLFVCLYLGALVLLAKASQTGRREYWYGAVALTGLAAATLEVALVLALTAIVCGILAKDSLRPDLRFWLRSTLVLVLTAVIIWPGAILRLAFLKAYFFMTYLAVVRKAAWGSTFTEAWAARLWLTPVELTMIAVAIAAWIGVRRARDPRALPFGIFGILMLLFVIRVNATAPRYLLPFLPAWIVFAVYTLRAFFSAPAIRRAILVSCTAAACLLIVANTQRVAAARALGDPRAGALLAAIHARNLERGTLQVPHSDASLLHYYLPAARLVQYDEEAPMPSVQGVDATIYPDYPIRIDMPAAR